MVASSSTFKTKSTVQEKYVVVEWIEEVDDEGNTPMSVVSSKWIIQDEEDSEGKIYCLWPSYKTDNQRNKAVERHAELNKENCTKNLINVKYSSAEYQKTISRMKLLEERQSVSTSDSEDERKRAKKKPKILVDYIEACASDEESVPTPPLLPKILHKVSSLCPSQVQETVDSIRGLSPLRSSSPVTSRVKNTTVSVDSPSRSLKPCFPLVQGSSNNPPRTFRDQERFDFANVTSRSPTSYQVQNNCQCNENKVLITRTLKIVESIQKDIQEFLRRENTNNNENLEIDQNGILINSTEEELIQFNNYLTEEVHMKAILASLQGKGGKDIVDATKRILGRIITNDLACKINWTGKNEKIAFAQLRNIRNLIIYAVRRNKKCTDAMEDEIEDSIKGWFRNAPDRDGGRSRRKQK